MTNTRGRAVDLTGLRANVFIADPIAITELHLAFSPMKDAGGGQLVVTLPRGATVARFAVKAGERWLESTVAARDEGKPPPANAVRTTGGSLSILVPSLRAQPAPELIVSYSQPISGGDYRLPLAGLGALQRFSVRAVVAGHRGDEPLELGALDRKPASDLKLRALVANGTVAVVGGRSAVIRTHPTFSAKTRGLADVPIRVEGATRVWPQTVGDIRSGDELLIHAAFAYPPSGPVRVRFGDEALEGLDIEPARVDSMIVDREIIGARTRALSSHIKDNPDDILDNYWRYRLLRLAQDFHVATSEHAFVISDAAIRYARFGIHHSPLDPMMSIEDGFLWVANQPARPSNGAWEFDEVPPPDWLETQAFFGGVLNGDKSVHTNPSGIFEAGRPRGRRRRP